MANARQPANVQPTGNEDETTYKQVLPQGNPLDCREIALFRETHFDYEISETPYGTRVRVTHMPSGKTRVVDSVLGESVGRVRQRLRKEIESELFSPGDFRTQIRRNRGRMFVKVSHTPSGISRQADQVDNENAFDVKIQFIDEILLELMKRHRQDTEGR